MRGDKKRVVVLISGGGTNLQALIDASQRKDNEDYPAEIVAVISNKADAYGLQRAHRAGIASCVISHKDFSSREKFDKELSRRIESYSADIVCLAGFMRLLTAEFVERWYGKMINIHPSLLPSFKGLDTHRRAIEAGVRYTGCTTHFVVPEMDAGPIILQDVVKIRQDDTPETLASRVLEAEHKIYVESLRLLAAGKLTIDGNRVIIDEDDETASGGW